MLIHLRYIFIYLTVNIRCTILYCTVKFRYTQLYCTILFKYIFLYCTFNFRYPFLYCTVNFRYIMIYCAAYSSFTVIYEYCGGPAPYEDLSWKAKPITCTIIVAAAMLYIMLSPLLFHAVYLTRLKLYYMCCRKMKAF